MAETAPRPLISVLFITYDRLHTLVDTFESLRACTAYAPLETIVCDDGSPEPVRDAIARMPFDIHLLGERNRGLGHNSNKGLEAARGELILQLQDDWHCDGPPDFLEAGVELLNERPDVGVIRYRPFPPGREPAFDDHVTASGRHARVFKPFGNPEREQLYTDNPHMKRRELHRDIGGYLEGVPMTRMELEFSERFNAQERWRIADFPGLRPFHHTGADASFNPIAKRDALRARLLAHPLTRWPFRAFLWLRGREP